MRLLRLAPITLVAALLALFGWRLVAETDGRNLANELRAGEAPTAPDFELALR